MGSYFWLTDGIYLLAEITNAQRCSKRRIMILRAIGLDTIQDNKIYVVYKLKGKGI